SPFDDAVATRAAAGVIMAVYQVAGGICPEVRGVAGRSARLPGRGDNYPFEPRAAHGVPAVEEKAALHFRHAADKVAGAAPLAGECPPGFTGVEFPRTHDRQLVRRYAVAVTQRAPRGSQRFV